MKNILKLALIALLLFSVPPCMAIGMKDNLTVNEYEYINNTFYPILMNAHICTRVHADCVGGRYLFCGDADEALACDVYGITDEKVIKELFMSMLKSGLKVSSFVFHRSKYHEGSFFEKPLMEFIDRTGEQ